MGEKNKGAIMESHVGYFFIIVAPTIQLLLYLIGKGLLWMILLGGSGLFVLVRYIEHTNSRKETLNIIQNGKTLYFSLSDDLLFSIKIREGEEYTERVKEIIQKEIVSIRDIVYRIDFVNFKNDLLHQELNDLIKE